MIKGYLFPVSKFFIAALVILFGAVVALGETSLEDLIAQEESGIEIPADLDKAPVSKAPGGQGLVTNTIPQDSVLLIPNSSDDNVGMFDPYDGHFLGLLITDSTRLSTPISPIKGPDGNIYLSDQLGDAVYVYDTSGAYLSTFCDATDSLDNVRGIDFRNDTLFVTSGDNYVAMFDAPHNRLPDFISGVNCFDILFLDDGRSLLSSLTSPAGVRLYDVDGTLLSQVVSVSFPEQTNEDDLSPGPYLNASFSSDVITDFDLNGSVYETSPLNGARGVYRLGNGNLLVTSSSGVQEMQPGTGNIIETEDPNQARFIELFVLESGTPFIGRCCYNDNAACVDTNEAACTALGGTWDAGLDCTADPCTVSPEGRCCYNSNQDCVDTTEAGCTSLGGNWSEGLNCTDDPCPTGGDCDYVPGDVNGSDSYNGLDITYGVNYFKGGSDPLCPNGSCPIPPCDAFFYCGDVNGSCSYNGLDITYGVAFFKGGSAPINCADCPPAP
jgi:hypothetical protein